VTPFRFLQPAEAELLKEISYYAAIRPELGSRFERAVAEAVRSAVAKPEQGAPRSKNTRRWLVKGFPFCVIYKASGDEVLIAAVAHLRRRPDYWASRLE
jgi:plasmid stabilization system protein ParE